MKPHCIKAQDVKPDDFMNYVEHPRSYDRVVKVSTTGDRTHIHFFTMAYQYYTVKHPHEGVVVWR
jgi:hypothetical protein